MNQFNIKYLKNKYGLSCIEDYVLYLLVQKNRSWQQIFYKSFLEFSEILELMNSGQTYSCFKGIARLQEVGQSLGMLKLAYCKNNYFPYKEIKNRKIKRCYRRC